MHYVKKMSVLRQLRQGFTSDGRPLSGLIKIEQYGKNLSAEIAVVNLAPLETGEYLCILTDARGETEVLSLKEDTRFSLLSSLDVSSGFCALLCFAKNDVLPLAYAVNGNLNVDAQKLAQKALLTRKKEEEKIAVTEVPADEEETQDTQETKETPRPIEYDDEAITATDYFKQEDDDEHDEEPHAETACDAHVESGTEKQGSEEGDDPSPHEDGESVLHAFTTDSDGYYRSVKAEIDELFENYPKDDTLAGAYPSSEWVRVKGEEGDPKQLVGIVYEDGKAKYVCYALPAESEEPPEELKGSCFFVPVSPFDKRGFFVIYQSAATGECIKPKEA